MNIIEQLGIAPYNEGGLVENAYTGSTCMLTAEELAVYDFIIGAEKTLMYDSKEMDENTVYKLRTDFHKGLNWFKETNARVYMELLD